MRIILPVLVFVFATSTAQELKQNCKTIAEVKNYLHNYPQYVLNRVHTENKSQIMEYIDNSTKLPLTYTFENGICTTTEIPYRSTELKTCVTALDELYGSHSFQNHKYIWIKDLVGITIEEKENYIGMSFITYTCK